MTHVSTDPLFAAVLISDGPHPDIPPQHRLFAPLIGSWDLLITWLDSGGETVRQERGEWHFSWVLEGRAIQDVWLWPPRSDRVTRPGEGEYGTSLRYFDAALGVWHSLWVGPMHNYVRRFTARRVGDTVVLETLAGDQPAMRWTFDAIERDAFTWRNEVLDDAGWRIQQHFAARRTATHDDPA
ncbi:hypothetical protein [Sphingomonas sp. ERG5]|uniref:hypothetical protein n=1 Tax=Sphingomonas sp. ERG5 TaxID=1381597 RepID=UPI00054B8E36|nr:hypothetical protein [Sphingomonas sp. ERG5]